MNEITKTDPSALSLILYPYQFEKVNKEFEWSNKHTNKLSKLFDVQKLQIIGKNIDNYFENKDIDLTQVLPSMKANTQDKEILLKCIRIGIKSIITEE